MTTSRRTPPTTPARSWGMPSEESRAVAIRTLERILTPLIVRLGLEDAWRAAVPTNTTGMGPLNFLKAIADGAPRLFADLAHADTHLWGAFLDGSLRASRVILDADDKQLSELEADLVGTRPYPGARGKMRALTGRDHAGRAVLIAWEYQFPANAKMLLDHGLLGFRDDAVIAVSRDVDGTYLWSIMPTGVTYLGTLLEIAEAGVAALLPLQAPR